MQNEIWGHSLDFDDMSQVVYLFASDHSYKAEVLVHIDDAKKRP